MRIPIPARIFLAAITLGALAGFIVPTSSDKLSQVNSCLDIKVQVERCGCMGECK